MQHDLNRPAGASADIRSNNRLEVPSYSAPTMYLIGRSNELLQGSGRHKNDDTGRPGFIVDQR
jgi:hypothetical protein